MTVLNGKDSMVLGLGDIIAFSFALFSTLILRYQSLPETSVLLTHFSAFSFIFVFWIIIFFIAGLYEKQTIVLKGRLPQLVLKAQATNSLIAIAFFYFVPYFGIAPKINLFIDLVFSFLFILIWRLSNDKIFFFRQRQDAIAIGTGQELSELVSEVNQNGRYAFIFKTVLDAEALSDDVLKSNLERFLIDYPKGIVAIDLNAQKVKNLTPILYYRIFHGLRFLDLHQLYESVFDRIPISLLDYRWFLENIATERNYLYSLLKRVMDIIFSFALTAISLLFYPLVWILIKFDDGGPIFIFQDRIGQHNKPIRILKFRTMTDGPKELSPEERITRVGRF